MTGHSLNMPGYATFMRAQQSSLVDVIPGTLFAVGGCISAETPLPWIATGSHGWVPHQCYVFRSGGNVVLIDGGLAVHRQEIAAGLAPLLKGDGQHVILTTRRDVDAIINLPWLLREFRFERVYFASGELSPLEFFAAFDKASAEAQVYAMTSPVPVEWADPGRITVFDSLRFVFLRPRIRVLASTWLYEASTRTLFSSDSFGFLTIPAPSGPTAVKPSDAQIATGRIVDFLNAKFDWLCGIDTSIIINDLRALLDERPIERVCPSYGCTIEGRDSVQLLFARTIEALKFLSTQPKPSVMAGFDWSRYPEALSSGTVSA